VKPWVKLSAAAAAVGLLAGGYFFAQSYRAEDLRKKMEGTQMIKLIDATSENLQRFSNSSGLAMERSGESWAVKSGLPLKIDQDEARGLAYSVTAVSANRVIEENPKELAPFGLEPPRATARVEIKDKPAVEVSIGIKTPGNDQYYISIKGDPKVYTVNSYTAERLTARLEELRDKKLPGYDPQAVKYLRLASGPTTIEIEKAAKPEDMLANLGLFQMTKPFKIPRGVDAEKFGALLESAKALRVRSFVEDRPKELSKYGLDKPAFDLFVQTDKESLHLQVGKEASATSVYAKLGGSPEVFILDDLRKDLAVKPFELGDRFALIIDITKVERMSLKGRGKAINAEIKRETVKDKDGKEETKESYFVNGKPVEEKPFKEFYQACIGLAADAPNAGPAAGRAETVIEYLLNASVVKKASLELVPVNRDFYAARRDGVAELLVSTRQVDAIFGSLGKLGF